MNNDINRISQYWDDFSLKYNGKNSGLFWWQAGPEIGYRINRKISGNPTCDFTTYTLRTYFKNLPLENCLVLGCGTGDLERSLARQGAFRRCDAVDISERSIAIAKKYASQEGMTTINYRIADINTLQLPVAEYDAVWVKDAMHHFQALEHVCIQVKNALKPGGFFILNEYIGPNRFQFPARQKEIANACLRILPKQYRVIVSEAVERDAGNPISQRGGKWFFKKLIEKIRDGTLLSVAKRRIRAYRGIHSGEKLYKEQIDFPSEQSLMLSDPSEAVRSAEIVPILGNYFEIVEKKDWGGNILQFLLADIAGNFAKEDEQPQALMKMLINTEETLLSCGEFSSDYAYIVAR